MSKKNLKSNDKFNVTIETVDGVEVSKETENLEETFFEFKPQFITGKIKVRVSKGDKLFEKLLFVPQARRCFYNEFALKLFVRNIERVLT